MNASQSSSPLPWNRRLLYGLANWGLFCAGAVNLAVGTRSALNGQVAIAATSLTAGLVLLFAGTIDRFESLKGLGIEAKTRQLDEKIEQAADALKRLKALAELTGASLVDLNSKAGRWGSAPGPRESYELAQRVRSTMNALGSDPSTVREALRPWVKMSCYDIALAITEPLNRALLEKKQELHGDLSKVRQPVDPSDPTYLRITAAIRDVGTYEQQRFHKLDRLDIDDYPDRFLQLIAEAPHVDQQLVAVTLDKARQFAPAMSELRRRLELADPEPWFTEIEEHRKRD